MYVIIFYKLHHELSYFHNQHPMIPLTRSGKKPLYFFVSVCYNKVLQFHLIIRYYRYSPD